MITINKSILSESSICEIITAYYGMSSHTAILISSGENDVYKVFDKDNTFIFKVYGKNTPNDLSMVNNVVSDFYNINYIITTVTKELHICIECPEGHRNAVLYYYFEGQCAYRNAKFINLCGVALAQFHQFKLNHYTKNDIYINSLNFKSIFESCHLTDSVKNRIIDIYNFHLKFDSSLLYNYEISYCHGDCHFKNFILNNNIVSLIDFDDAHIDYTLYDVTYVIWTCFYQFKNSLTELLCFLKGYYTYRSFQPFVFEILEYFFIKIEISHLIYCLRLQTIIGLNVINGDFINRRIDLLYGLNNYINNINKKMLN